MFIRFRASARRLDLILIETKREGGKVRSEHIASLGSCPVEPTVADRVAFWRCLFERLDKLGNRIGDDRLKILDTVQARIPMPTQDEQQALGLKNAKQDASLSAVLRDNSEADIEELRAMKAVIESKIANRDEAAKATGQWAKSAAERLAKIEAGEAVGGGLGKPMTREVFIAILRKAGWTQKKILRMQWLASLDAGVYMQASAAALETPGLWEAHDAMVKRLMRRAIRERANS